MTRADAEPFVFISYARSDIALAGSLVEALETEGIPVWWDQSLEGSSLFREATEAALAAAAAVIVLWTPASIASGWVVSEAIQGRDSGRYLSLCDDCVPPIGFRQFQYLEMATDGQSVEAGFAVRLAGLVKRSFLAARPRLVNRRGFIAIDFAHAYRLRAPKAAAIALAIQAGFYVMSFAAEGFESWISADGTIMLPERLSWAFVFSWVSLWIGRLILPDRLGLRRSTKERFFERRPVLVWIFCLLAMLVPLLIVRFYTALTNGIDINRLFQTVFSVPFAAGGLFIVPCIVMRLLNDIGLIDRVETIRRAPRERSVRSD